MTTQVQASAIEEMHEVTSRRAQGETRELGLEGQEFVGKTRKR